jgi:hypothetical protein
VRPNPEIPDDDTLHDLFGNNGGDDWTIKGLRAVWRHGADAAMAPVVSVGESKPEESFTPLTDWAARQQRYYDAVGESTATKTENEETK